MHEGKDRAKIIEGYIPVTGGNIWYKIVGINRKKIPLLVLYCGPGAPHGYLEPFKALSDERPVIFYDQLGCENSDYSLRPLPQFVSVLCRSKSLSFRAS